MSNIKFFNNKYQRFKYNLKDSIVNKRKPNYPIKKENIGLSVPKRYSFFYSYQKRNKENNKKDSIDIRLLYYLQINTS